MSDIAGNTEFKVTNTKLYITIVNLSTKDNVKLTKQLSEGFKRLVYWNECKTKLTILIIVLKKTLKEVIFFQE